MINGASQGIAIAVVMIVLAIPFVLNRMGLLQRARVPETMTAQERLAYERRKGELFAEQELRARQ